ncbi:hypothetical protein [Pseudanabaena sp. BC1403]|uniref:hypothetical protein n=1 Tax=Pseudanabaena sp. BC1403 TaxID=2043171 RepID=UPI0021562168|nr:hypothetical protein [Pseudanabaena sp. BC1403]
MVTDLLSLAVSAVRVIVWVIAAKRIPMTKGIPEKCKKCAMLSAAQAQELHGDDGNRCWSPNVCYSRRSYARHRDRRNLIRSRKRSDSDTKSDRNPKASSPITSQKSNRDRTTILKTQ